MRSDPKTPELSEDCVRVCICQVGMPCVAPSTRHGLEVDMVLKKELIYQVESAVVIQKRMQHRLFYLEVVDVKLKDYKIARLCNALQHSNRRCRITGICSCWHIKILIFVPQAVWYPFKYLMSWGRCCFPEQDPVKDYTMTPVKASTNHDCDGPPVPVSHVEAPRSM